MLCCCSIDRKHLLYLRQTFAPNSRRGEMWKNVLVWGFWSEALFTLDGRILALGYPQKMALCSDTRYPIWKYVHIHKIEHMLTIAKLWVLCKGTNAWCPSTRSRWVLRKRFVHIVAQLRIVPGHQVWTLPESRLTCDQASVICRERRHNRRLEVYWKSIGSYLRFR